MVLLPVVAFGDSGDDGDDCETVAGEQGITRVLLIRLG